MNTAETKSEFAVGGRSTAGFGVKEPLWVSVVRQNGKSLFNKSGLPTVRNEDWRFTNVAALAEFSFEPASTTGVEMITKASIAKLPFASLPGSRLVFVNGIFAPDISAITPFPEGVKVMNLASALASEPALVQRHLFHHAGAEINAFAGLNAAYFQDGAFIYVPANVTVAEPIQLLFVSTAANGETTHPRNLIIAERGSQITVLESFVSLTNTAHFTNSVSEIIAGENATVEHLKLQYENEHAFHMATIAATGGRTSNIVAHSFALGAKLSRTNIYANLAGEGLECVLNGLYLTRGTQLADHFMIVDHAAPHCASHEYFNGILADKSKGVFHGRIHVRPGAQKTDAKQTNKNLLLSDEATVDTKPQLEIYADDVKCTHGATVGQLNEDSVFYLRTRGIPLEKARRMLFHAFAGEITERVRYRAVRDELDQLIWNHLEQNEAITMERK